ncbi:glycosyltransferase [Thermus phage YS40_Isch]|nr:glycosyltransferase [Thermus phage YS40_Isch]
MLAMRGCKDEIYLGKLFGVRKIGVKSFTYVIDKDEDRGNIIIHDDFSKTIVSRANFKNLYNILKEGEDFYLYLLEDFEENPNEKDVFRIESFAENVNLLHEQKEEVNISGSYADYMVFRLNKYFRNAYKDLIEKRVKRLRIVCSIYRVQEISQLYNEYAVLEAEIFLNIKEVI